MSTLSDTENLSTRVSKKTKAKKQVSKSQEVKPSYKLSDQKHVSTTKKTGCQALLKKNTPSLLERKLGLTLNKKNLEHRPKDGFKGVTGIPRNTLISKRIEKSLKKSYTNPPVNRFYIAIISVLLAFSWGGWHIGKLAYSTARRNIDVVAQSEMVKRWVADVTQPRYEVRASKTNLSQVKKRKAIKSHSVKHKSIKHKVTNRRKLRK